MRLTKYSHSCLRVEDGGGVLVIDPGGFSEAASLDGVDAILVTHEHADHLDVDKIGDALARHPQAQIYTHPDVAAKLAALGDVVRPVRPGESFEAAGMSVRAYGGLHAVIHPDLPRVANLGFLVQGRVYHPGDSFDVPEFGNPIDTVFVPVTAPWLKASDAIDFVRAIRPRRAYALHDCLGTDPMLGILGNLMANLTDTPYARLTPGEALDL